MHQPGRRSIRRSAGALAVAVTVPLTVPWAGADAGETPPACAPGAAPVVLEGEVARGDAKTYLLLPFDVDAATTRVEVGYAWADKGFAVGPLTTPAPPSSPLTQTVFDLGLWDSDGYRAVEGFRGWSGSRQGKLHAGQAPVFVQADDAPRNYVAAPVEAGVWWVELGVAAVGPFGATWRVEITCSAPAVGPPPVPDPVDPAHVAKADAGWYHGDFHMHAYHSSTSGPPWPRFVEYAREAGLDFLPITEYVTNVHWDELGQVQRDNPDLLIWPGREIITYFGHANVLNETRNVIEYRHGFEDITITDIQFASVADGGLYQVAHPTTFPGPVFSNFCRGCEYTLLDDTDWRLVDTIEVLTGPILVDDSALGGPGVPLQMQNPFTQPAIDLWEDLLRQGHRVTAVSGSDDKAGPGLGMNATAVYARNLSRAGIVEAVRAGHAYVRTRGVHDSPALEMVARTEDGQQGIFGDALRASRAQVAVTVTGGAGQLLRIIANGRPMGVVPITGDDFTHTFTALRLPHTEGRLGTFWRVETLDERSLTTIGNPIFLQG